MESDEDKTDGKIDHSTFAVETSPGQTRTVSIFFIIVIFKVYILSVLGLHCQTCIYVFAIAALCKGQVDTGPHLLWVSHRTS